MRGLNLRSLNFWLSVLRGNRHRRLYFIVFLRRHYLLSHLLLLSGTDLFDHIIFFLNLRDLNFRLLVSVTLLLFFFDIKVLLDLHQNIFFLLLIVMLLILFMHDIILDLHALVESGNFLKLLVVVVVFLRLLPQDLNIVLDQILKMDGGFLSLVVMFYNFDVIDVFFFVVLRGGKGFLDKNRHGVLRLGRTLIE